jgi:hypothetical protein
MATEEPKVFPKEYYDKIFDVSAPGGEKSKGRATGMMHLITSHSAVEI